MRRVLLALAVVAGTSGAALAAADTHSHDGHAGGELRLDNGAKWATDAALRAGMGGIHQAVTAVVPRLHANKLTAEDYVALAGAIETQIEGIVKDCKLSPEADEQLHLVLAQVIDGMEAMRKDGHRLDGAVAVVMALDAYGKFFDHPGWTSFH